MTEQLHVIVVGGGIGGLCLAQGLRRAGVSVAVYERFGKTFTHYEQHDGKVAAFFDDGSCATGDLLVGVDGAGSVVRRQFLPHARRVPTEATATALRFPLTEQTRSWVPQRLATSMNMIIAPDPFFLFTSVFQRRSGYGDQEGLADHNIATGRPYQSYILCAFVRGSGPRLSRLDLPSPVRPAARRGSR
jgi:2-polyprenyl-6-methoxyphenol hydroxylase-like FAD-dependent oxidoreductase